ALDRLEQERGARALAQAQVRAERREQVCGDCCRHGKRKRPSRVFERAERAVCAWVSAGSRPARCARPRYAGRGSLRGSVDAPGTRVNVRLLAVPLPDLLRELLTTPG